MPITLSTHGLLDSSTLKGVPDDHPRRRFVDGYVERANETLSKLQATAEEVRKSENLTPKGRREELRKAGEAAMKTVDAAFNSRDQGLGREVAELRDKMQKAIPREKDAGTLREVRAAFKGEAEKLASDTAGITQARIHARSAGFENAEKLSAGEALLASAATAGDHTTVQALAGAPSLIRRSLAVGDDAIRRANLALQEHFPGNEETGEKVKALGAIRQLVHSNHQRAVAQIKETSGAAPTKDADAA